MADKCVKGTFDSLIILPNVAAWYDDIVKPLSVEKAQKVFV